MTTPEKKSQMIFDLSPKRGYRMATREEPVQDTRGISLLLSQEEAKKEYGRCERAGGNCGHGLSRDGMNRISVRDTMWLPQAGLVPTVPTETKRMMCACRRYSILVNIINEKHRV